MTTKQTRWTTLQAYVMAILCLALGVATGFLSRGAAASVSRTRPAVTQPSSSPSDLKAASTEAATPVLDRLQTDPKNFKLLVEAGEMYYHHAAYAEAAGFYERALAVEDNIAVRNQYASALFYQREADGALRQYAKVLQANPTNEVALFNAGMVRLKGKNDAKGAVALWEKLLRAYPHHPQRERVQKMIERASHQG